MGEEVVEVTLTPGVVYGSGNGAANGLRDFRSVGEPLEEMEDDRDLSSKYSRFPFPAPTRRVENFSPSDTARLFLPFAADKPTRDEVLLLELTLLGNPWNTAEAFLPSSLSPDAWTAPDLNGSGLVKSINTGAPLSADWKWNNTSPSAVSSEDDLEGYWLDT